MGASVETVRRLAWSLVVLGIAAGVLQVIYTLALPPLPPPPPFIEDLVQRLESFVAIDAQLFPFVVVLGLVTIGVFVVAALLGTALRSWARSGSLRDAMVVLFVIGATLGIAANVLNIGVAQAASNGYCDCGFKTEELIARDYALQTGWQAINWLNIAAVTLTGLGVAVAGRALDLSSAWRMVSYAIVALLLLAVGIRVIAAFTFIAAFDPFQVSDLLIAVAAGILVPIWAILLARDIRGYQPQTADEYAAAPAR
jgi:hypothetical protein